MKTQISELSCVESIGLIRLFQFYATSFGERITWLLECLYIQPSVLQYAAEFRRRKMHLLRQSPTPYYLQKV